MKKFFQPSKETFHSRSLFFPYHLANQKGSSLVEVIVSAAIVLIIMSGLYATHTFFISQTFSNTQKIKAHLLVEEGVEAVKTMRDRGWTNISGLTADSDYYLVFSGGMWATSTTPSAIDGIFYRKFQIAAVSRDSGGNIVESGGTPDNGTKKVTVTIDWSDHGATSTRTLSTYLADIL